MAVNQFPPEDTRRSAAQFVAEKSHGVNSCSEDRKLAAKQLGWWERRLGFLWLALLHGNISSSSTNFLVFFVMSKLWH